MYTTRFIVSEFAFSKVSAFWLQFNCYSLLFFLAFLTILSIDYAEFFSCLTLRMYFSSLLLILRSFLHNMGISMASPMLVYHLNNFIDQPTDFSILNYSKRLLLLLLVCFTLYRNTLKITPTLSNNSSHVYSLNLSRRHF